jgi:dihydropteroate synthase
MNVDPSFTPDRFSRLTPDQQADYLASLPDDHPMWLFPILLGISKEQFIGRILLREPL